MRAIGVSVVSLVVMAGPALSATCTQPNPAGGQTSYECVHGEELKVDAPSLGTSNLPTMNAGEMDALQKLMNSPKAAPAQAVPAQPAGK